MRGQDHPGDAPVRSRGRRDPEPDLAPLRISDEWRGRLLAEMPELPASKRANFVESLGLREYDAEVLTATRPLSEYFEQVAATSQDPRAAANWGLS